MFFFSFRACVRVREGRLEVYTDSASCKERMKPLADGPCLFYFLLPLTCFSSCSLNYLVCPACSPVCSASTWERRKRWEEGGVGVGGVERRGIDGVEVCCLAVQNHCDSPPHPTPLSSALYPSLQAYLFPPSSRMHVVSVRGE